MITKFKIDKFYFTIQKEIVEKESDHYVWVEGRRVSKIGDVWQYCDSFAQAQELLLLRMNSKIKYHKEQIDSLTTLRDRIALQQEVI
jgi:hypothetical protein